MKDYDRIVGELIDIATTTEQVLFLKNLDLKEIFDREEARQQTIIELSTIKSTYTNVIKTIVDTINKGY